MTYHRNTAKTHGIAGTHKQTTGYQEARDKLMAILPTGVGVEIYRRPDGSTQVNWLPARPNFRLRAVRQSILPGYDVAVAEYTSAFGAPVKIHGSAYESGARAGT